MSGMTWEVSGIVFRLWMLSLMGVEIALTDHPSIIRLSELFTYLNGFSVAVGHMGSD